MRGRSYTSRMIAAGISSHTVAPMPEATRAEFESKVYDQTWALAATHASRTSFAVLALDRRHAEAIGRLRLTGAYGASADAMVLLECVEWPFDADRVENILRYESATERDHRRAAYAERRVA